MANYIKKFESASAANNYKITDIPFTTTVSGETAQNLVCNESNKKLVNNNGIVTVEGDVALISFTILRDTVGETYHFQAESGMTWTEFCESEYNTATLVVTDNGKVRWEISEPEYVYYAATEVEGDHEIFDGAEYVTIID